MDKLVSIIIPVYNVERYLIKCVKSVITQDYQPIEIILVDDGSTDDSGEICDEFCKNYSNIKVIHKKNGGLSEARNWGIEASSGTYICCIDSDDYIEEGYISYLMALIEKYDSDMSICNISYVDNGVIINPVKEKKEYLALPGEILEKILDEIDITESACAKMYKKCLFDGVEYPIGRTEEDLATTYKLVGRCNTIAFGNSKSYFYVNRRGSITKKCFSDDNYNILWAFEGMKKYVLEFFPEISESCLKRECSIYMRLLQSALKNKVNDARIMCVRKDFRRMVFHCLTNRKVRFVEKIRYVLIAFFPKMYICGYNIFTRMRIFYFKNIK